MAGEVGLPPPKASRYRCGTGSGTQQVAKHVGRVVPRGGQRHRYGHLRDPRSRRAVGRSCRGALVCACRHRVSALRFVVCGGRQHLAKFGFGVLLHLRQRGRVRRVGGGLVPHPRIRRRCGSGLGGLVGVPQRGSATSFWVADPCRLVIGSAGGRNCQPASGPVGAGYGSGRLIWSAGVRPGQHVAGPAQTRFDRDGAGDHVQRVRIGEPLPLRPLRHRRGARSRGETDLRLCRL